MALDPKRLREDARRLQEARLPTTVGKETTGTTKAIRFALPVIYDLRREGVTWPVIAQALADQGIVQGQNRTPLTTKRLTAIVSQIEEQERKKAAKASRVRSDAVEVPAGRRRKLSLSADLVASRPASESGAEPTEEELRRSAFEKIQSVLKKE